MDNSLQNTITKTCSVCKQSKPLTAFLELTGPSGTTYGNVCASCRKTAQDKALSKETEESSKSSSGLKIDAKMKLQEEINKKQHLDFIKDLNQEEHKKDQQEEQEDLEKTAQITLDQKKHRESRESFFSGKRPSQETFTREAALDPVAQQQAEIKEKSTAEQLVKEDLEARTVNPHSAFIPSQTGYQVKHHAEVMLKLRQWLGPSSGMFRAAEQATKKAEANKAAGVVEKETSVKEDIQREYGPSSPVSPRTRRK